MLNGIDFGEAAIMNLNHYKIRFYDRHLKGIENGIEHDPRVQRLRARRERVVERAMTGRCLRRELTPFYFHSNGHANSLKGDGVLSIAAPGNGARRRVRITTPPIPSGCSGRSRTARSTTASRQFATTCSATRARC